MCRVKYVRRIIPRVRFAVLLFWLLCGGGSGYQTACTTGNRKIDSRERREAVPGSFVLFMRHSTYTILLSSSTRWLYRIILYCTAGGVVCAQRTAVSAALRSRKNRTFSAYERALIRRNVFRIRFALEMMINNVTSVARS